MVSRILKKVIAAPSKLKVKTGKKPRGELRKAKTGTLRKATTSDAFLARRQVMGGAQAALRKVPKKPGYMEGAVTGAGATAATALYLKNKKARKEAQAKDDKDLKKAMEQHKKKTEAKRKKYGKHHG